MKILVTGASGFLGRALVRSLSQSKFPLICAVRSLREGLVSGPDYVTVGDIDSRTDWTESLTGVSIVIHCAARVHVMNEDAKEPLAAFRRVNVGATLGLAKQSAEIGVKRFIFISSIKVNGESTSRDQAFSSHSVPMPQDPYSQSKHEAEVGLKEIAEKTGMEIVVIRPPLVYGQDVKGNFHSLFNLVSKGVPLPLKLIRQNSRSMVYVGNLVNLVETCIVHPQAANQTFLVSDDEDISTEHLVRLMGFAMNRKVNLFPVPIWLFKLLGKLTGRTKVVDRLIGSLQVDLTQTKEKLNWNPPYTVSEGMKLTIPKSD